MKKSSDLSKIIEKGQENSWVALSSDRKKVLGTSKSLIDLRNKVTDKEAVYMKVLAQDSVFAF